MKPPNCWEIKQCGREPGGVRVSKLGVCPAARDRSFNGTNRGENAGRYCWRIAGTFCEGKSEGSFTDDLMSCAYCEFYRSVQEEEGDDLQL
jgi:hypothetical protein